MRKGSKQGPRIDVRVGQPQDRPFKDAAEEFFRLKEATGRSFQTIKTYRYQLRYFLEFAGEGVMCSEMTLEMLTDYLEHLRTVKGITNFNTLNTAIQNLSPIIHYIQEKGWCPHRYMMPFQKGQQVDKPPYTEAELARLLEPPETRDFKSVRTWAIVWTLASTGVRARELRELRIANIDMTNMLIHLQETKNKKPRRIPMSAALFEVLGDYNTFRHPEAAEDDAPYFCTVYGEKMYQSTLSDSVREWTLARGIDRPNAGGLHIFRHTFITHAVATGVSPMMLQRITGHSTMQQLGHYYHERIEDMADIINTITPSLKKDRRRKF